jgi:tetratricopeptide (TPR) repeat protein
MQRRSRISAALPSCSDPYSSRRRGPAPKPLTRRLVTYQRDYLMRQIEIAGQMLARILGLAKRGRGDEALGLFDQAYQPLLGVSARVVSTLSEEQLLSLLTSGSMPDLRRVATVLELLKVEADLLDAAGNRAAAVARYRRALALAGFLAARSAALPDTVLAADLVERVGALELTVAQRTQLARVLEALGRYADAEDALFEAIDADPDDPGPVDAAIAFCQRLLALEPAALAAGGLPLDEVKASLAELLQRQPAVTHDDEPPAW